MEKVDQIRLFLAYLIFPVCLPSIFSLSSLDLSPSHSSVGAGSWCSGGCVTAIIIVINDPWNSTCDLQKEKESVLL